MTIPVHELPKIDDLFGDIGFRLRVEHELNHSTIARELGREFPLAHLVSWAMLSFHPDGKIPARCRELGMNDLSKRLLQQVEAVDLIERLDVDEAKRTVSERRELSRRLDAANELAYVKHFGVGWQAVYLLILSTLIAKRTGWNQRRVLQAVTEFVRIALYASETRLWFNEKELRDLVRTAMKNFERDPRHTYLLQRIRQMPIKPDRLLYLDSHAS